MLKVFAAAEELPAATGATRSSSAPGTARGRATSFHMRDVVASVGDPARRNGLGRRAQLLAAASVSCNVVEAVIAITRRMLAGWIILVGSGLDSLVEASSGLIILWPFRHPLPESRERRTPRLMALSGAQRRPDAALVKRRGGRLNSDPAVAPTGPPFCSPATS